MVETPVGNGGFPALNRWEIGEFGGNIKRQDYMNRWIEKKTGGEQCDEIGEMGTNLLVQENTSSSKEFPSTRFA